MRNYKKGLVILSTVVLLLVAAGATVAFTQTQEPQRAVTALPTVDRKPPEWLIRNIRQGRIERRLHELMTAALAEELDLSVEELRTAQQAAWINAIDQAESEGLISEERADLMRARIALAGYVQLDEFVANILGISVDELVAAHQQGKTIRQLAVELGLDWPTVRDNIRSVREETIQQAAEEGIITDEQADLLLNTPIRRPLPRPRH